LVKAINSREPTFEVKGSVDAKVEAEFLSQHQGNQSEISLAIGIGNTAVMKKLSETFKGFNFPNLIHPDNAGDFENIKMGEGNIITAGCNFTLGITLGSFNYFNLNCAVSHDVQIANFNIINSGCVLSGGVQMGSGNLIGAGAVVLQYLKIWSQNILGAGAVLTENLGDRKQAVGVPAKVNKDL
jgi:acetyltransferase-like isoleucine patch superfamily enzyme